MGILATASALAGARAHADSVELDYGLCRKDVAAPLHARLNEKATLSFVGPEGEVADYPYGTPMIFKDTVVQVTDNYPARLIRSNAWFDDVFQGMPFDHLHARGISKVGPDSFAISYQERLVVIFNQKMNHRFTFITQDEPVFAPVGMADGTIVVSDQSDNLYFLKPTGKLRKRVKLRDQSNFQPTLAADGLLMVGDGDLNYFNSSGQIVSKVPVGSWIDQVPQFEKDGSMILHTGKTDLKFYSRGGMWKVTRHLGELADLENAPAILPNGVVVEQLSPHLSNRQVVFFNPDGTEKKRFDTNEKATFDYPPVIHPDGLALISTEPRLYLFADDGELLSYFEPEGNDAINSAPLVLADKSIAIGTAHGRV
ncbi:MAG: hypothetical protein ACXWPM_11320, partial [Bdellovibrionota bacterium]